MLSNYDINDMPHGEYVERRNLDIKGFHTYMNSSVTDKGVNDVTTQNPPPGGPSGTPADLEAPYNEGTDNNE